MDIIQNSAPNTDKADSNIIEGSAKLSLGSEFTGRLIDGKLVFNKNEKILSFVDVNEKELFALKCDEIKEVQVLTGMLSVWTNSNEEYPILFFDPADIGVAASVGIAGGAGANTAFVAGSSGVLFAHYLPPKKWGELLRPYMHVKRGYKKSQMVSGLGIFLLIFGVLMLPVTLTPLLHGQNNNLTVELMMLICLAVLPLIAGSLMYKKTYSENAAWRRAAKNVHVKRRFNLKASLKMAPVFILLLLVFGYMAAYTLRGYNDERTGYISKVSCTGVAGDGSFILKTTKGETYLLEKNFSTKAGVLVSNPTMLQDVKGGILDRSSDLQKICGVDMYTFEWTSIKVANNN